MNGFAVSTADAPSAEDSARTSATAAARPARLMPRVSRKWVPWIIAGAIALAAAGGLWVYYHRPGTSGGAAATGAAAGGKFYTVTSMDMDVKVVKDGELQAVNNIDVMCMVEGQSTIVHIIKEGSEVKTGDLLVEIDSSQIRQQIDQTTLQHQKAEADLKSAREMLAIQQNQNEADIEAAQVQLELATLDLRQYTEGTYPQSLADAQTALEMAAITVKNKEEELEQTRNLFAKGFVTAAEVKSAELTVTTVRNDLRKAETALKVLTEYTHKMDLASKQSTVAQNEQSLARVKRNAVSSLAQVQADVTAKEQGLATLTDQLKKQKQQLANCTIEAPADGLVVYASNERGGQGPIADGVQVRERQLLLRLPDTRAMMAVLRVSESQVSRLEVGQRAVVKIVGVRDPIPAKLTKISPIADSGQRFWNPDSKEYPVELVLDHTPPNLKPGVSVQPGEVFVDELRGVLAVPLASIYSNRATSYVFVRDGDRVRPASVELAQTNDTHARVVKGLTAGQSVLLLQPGQGRELLESYGLAGADNAAQPGGGKGDRRGGKRRGGGTSDAPAAAVTDDAPKPESTPPAKPEAPAAPGAPKPEAAPAPVARQD